MNKQPWPNLRYWKLKTLSYPCANHRGTEVWLYPNSALALDGSEWVNFLHCIAYPWGKNL